MENNFNDSFNGKLRDECSNDFCNVDDTSTKIDAWRVNYNDDRPAVQSSSGHPQSLLGASRPLTLNLDDPLTGNGGQVTTALSTHIDVNAAPAKR